MLELTHQFDIEHVVAKNDAAKNSAYIKWSSKVRVTLAELMKMKYGYYSEIREFL